LVWKYLYHLATLVTRSAVNLAMVAGFCLQIVG
jgi:hypothetical protein